MSGITIPTLDEISGHTVMAKLRSLCKKFIGLAEEVDEKIDAPLEEAHQAVQTANTAVANANQSVQTANQAVQTANTASANANAASESAQESAEIVSTYNARVTALETADEQNVKLNGNQNINGIKNVPLETTGVISNQIASSQKIKNELDNYQPMMRLANLQTYTGVKELLKTSNILPSFIKITDVSSTEHPNLIYLTGIRNNDGIWLIEDRLGIDNDGARGFYNKSFKIRANDTDYTVNVRINLTTTGIQLQVSDPVNNIWRTVQLV